ncbi:hypothetical protein D3C71_1432930 [compost metagenome]
MVQVDVDHAHADLLHGDRARTEVGLQHDLLARDQPGGAEVLLGHALGQAFAAFAVGIGRLDVDLEAGTGFLVHHGVFQARDDVAVADQDRQRITVPGAFDRLLALLGNGVVETDDAVFFDLHAQLWLVAADGRRVGRVVARRIRRHHDGLLRWRIIRTSCS